MPKSESLHAQITNYKNIQMEVTQIKKTNNNHLQSFKHQTVFNLNYTCPFLKILLDAFALSE